MENAQFHKDLMLFSLNNCRGTLITVVVNSKNVMVNIMRVVISLQHLKMSQLSTTVVVNHESPRQSRGLWSTTWAVIISQRLKFQCQDFNNSHGGYHEGRSELN